MPVRLPLPITAMPVWADAPFASELPSNLYVRGSNALAVICDGERGLFVGLVPSRLIKDPTSGSYGISRLLPMLHGQRLSTALLPPAPEPPALV